MACPLRKTPASSERSPKACELDRGNVLVRSTVQMDLGCVEFLCSSKALNLPVLDVRVVLRELSTNCAHCSFHERNFGWITTHFLKDNKQIISGFQPRSRHVIPSLGRFAAPKLTLRWAECSGIVATVAFTISKCCPISANTFPIDPNLTLSHALQVQSKWLVSFRRIKVSLVPHQWLLFLHN
uniref:Uncharacterized protein n=1 Tax=Opuntia streptacantha TaxID=393608 RepID=A0A7C9F020_OPUST